MFSNEDQQALDIDWFFTNSEDIAFVASGGGQLPQSVSKSSPNNELLVSFFKNLPIISEVVINADLSKIKNFSMDERYLADFVAMAKKGLFSFDKTVLNNFSNPDYHLVAKPFSPLKIDRLPSEIRKILIESKYNGSIETYININSIT